MGRFTKQERTACAIFEGGFPERLEAALVEWHCKMNNALRWMHCWIHLGRWTAGILNLFVLSCLEIAVEIAVEIASLAGEMRDHSRQRRGRFAVGTPPVAH